MYQNVVNKNTLCCITVRGLQTLTTVNHVILSILFQLYDSNFVITFVGRGWEGSQYDMNSNHNLPPTQKIISQISGPDVAYFSTAIFLVQCGITLLRDIDRLPKG